MSTSFLWNGAGAGDIYNCCYEVLFYLKHFYFTCILTNDILLIHVHQNEYFQLKLQMHPCTRGIAPTFCTIQMTIDARRKANEMSPRVIVD